MINLTVKTLDSRNHAFSLEDDQITVRGFKEYIADSVAVPADSQRLIYCGRVLQDEKKLNDYAVNGKVIHLVQRAPPQPGQRGNDGGQSQNQNQGSQGWQNLQRAHYRFTRAQMHGNAMYLGAMPIPAEIVGAHGMALPHYSNRLSSGRLIIGGHMLERANRLMDRLENLSRPANPSPSENNSSGLGEGMQESEPDSEQFNSEGRTNGGARLTEAVAAATAAAVEVRNTFSLRGNNDENAETRPAGETTEDNQSDSQQPQPQTEQQGSTSNNGGQSNRRSSPQPPGPPQLAEFLELLQETQSRLHPHIERYHKLMRDDPSLPPGRSVEESQTYVDGVSECLHYMSHACHAFSDIIVDISQPPPRRLQCRQIVIQHSAILQPGIPLQVETHISLHGRNANNNNGTEENGDSTNNASQPESTEGNAEDSNQQPESEATAQQQEQEHSPFETVFNLPNNVEVLMEISPESNLDAASGSEQTQTGENNNNNNNNNNNIGGSVGGTVGAFSWGAAPSPEFLRALMQGITEHLARVNTTITSRNPTTVGQQNVTSMDSGNTNAGQSTQARSNVGTHPTTATQTRSTPRPHVFHQQTHPLGAGMNIRQIVDFDPFLQCNSHHFRPTSIANSNTVTSTSQSTQTSQTISETQSPAETATTSSATSNTSSANPIALVTLSQQILGDRSSQPQAGVGINSNDPELVESLGIVEDNGSAIGDNLSLLDILDRIRTEIYPSVSGDSEGEENFLLTLIQSMVQRMTLENFINLRIGRWEPIRDLREPLQEFLRYYFPNTSTEVLREEVVERSLSQLRPHLQNLLASENDIVRDDLRVDICTTVELIFRRHIVDILQRLFDDDLSDSRFGKEVLKIANNFARQLCAVLRYSIRGGQSGLELLASRLMNEILRYARPAIRRWVMNAFSIQFHNYSLLVTQPPVSEILPLLIYKDLPYQSAPVSSAPPTHQSSQPQPEAEPMETEATEERTNFETSLPNDGEEVPGTFPGHEALPSDWVPIIARDGVRQRRQLQMQGMNGGVATFSDAYLGTLPTKRRKLIEQQKPRLLVSPTPNHSAIAASMERLVREGVTRAGVEEVEGAAVAVAVDPGVRRAFGQAIRDCLNPRRYGTPDFPDPLRFPNATKYFSDQDRPPK